METVLTANERGVCTVTLNRPERLNAINAALLMELKQALARANADAHTKVIILRGAGRAFCTGDDLKEFDQQARTEAEARRYIEAIQDITRELVLGDKMVVGAIHGWAVGGGFEWLVNCDFPILAIGTRCFFPEVSLGIFVTGGVTTLLPKLIGLQRAKELILFGDQIDAHQALQMGLAWKVVPEKDLSAEAECLAQRIAALPEASVREVKRVINRACHLDAEGAMTLETEATIKGFLDPQTLQRVSQFGRKEEKQR